MRESDPNRFIKEVERETMLSSKNGELFTSLNMTAIQGSCTNSSSFRFSEVVLPVSKVDNNRGSSPFMTPSLFAIPLAK